MQSDFMLHLDTFLPAAAGIPLLLFVLALWRLLVYRRRLRDAREQLLSQKAELRRARKQARKLASRDPLTGLPNQEFLLAYLGRAIARASHGGERVGLGVFAIRELEHIERTHGLPLSNALLRNVAAALRESGCFLAAIQNGRFAVVFTGLKDRNAAELAAKQLIMETSGDYRLRERFVATELVGGLAVFPEHAAGPAELLRKAGLAAGKGRGEHVPFVVYEPDIELNTRGLIQVSELKKVLADEGLGWAYQPQYGIHEKAIIGAEILVRWLHPKFGLVPADHFIPMAEESGLINQITQRAISEAKATLTRWRQEGRPWRLSINVSANDLESASRVDEMLKGFEDHAPMLTLEITETAIMKNREAIMRNVEKFRNAKVSLSLDDYGTGYSSLASLKDFQFDEIKIDKCFIRNITTSERDRTLTKASIRLAHELGATVVAEGVEDRETASMLIELGCDILQGYAITHPLRYEQLVEFLENTQVRFD